MRTGTHHHEGDKKTIPTYLKWQGGGKDVYVSGSFNDWKENIPMVKRYSGAGHGLNYFVDTFPVF